MHVFPRSSPSTNMRSAKQRNVPSWGFLGQLAVASLLVTLIPLAAVAVLDDGMPDGWVGWTLPLARALVHLTSLVTIALLCVGVLLPGGARGDELSPEAERLGRRGSTAALAAVVACGVLLLLTYFDVLGAGPLQAGFSDFGLFLDQLASGRALIAQIAFLLASAVIGTMARTLTALRMALFLAVAGTTTLALGGHAASESGHGLAMFSMTGHIAAASLWVGGLAGLAWLAFIRSNLLHLTVRRFSRIALICATVVALSGVMSALVRVPDLATLASSSYGLVLLLKVLVLGLLITFGAMHRRRLLDGNTFSRADFGKLATGELVIMGVAYGLAVALVALQPPVPA